MTTNQTHAPARPRIRASLVGAVFFPAAVLISTAASAAADTVAVPAPPPQAASAPAGTLSGAPNLVEVIAKINLDKYFERLGKSVDRPIRVQHPRDQAGPTWKRRIGTGIAVSADGDILTTWSVVRQADAVEVQTPGSAPRVAKVVAMNPESNLALLRVTGLRLEAAALDARTTGVPGESVFLEAFDRDGRVTVQSAVVEAKTVLPLAMACPIGLILRAANFAGSSGGCCLDSSGRIVGIISGLLPGTGAADPAGDRILVIPSDVALREYMDLREGSTAERPWFGIDIALDSGPGALVTGIHPGSPAQHAGIRVGDRILSFDSHGIDKPIALIEQFCRLKSGRPVAIVVERGGARKTARVEPGARCEDAESVPAWAPDAEDLGFRVRARIGISAAPQAPRAGERHAKDD